MTPTDSTPQRLRPLSYAKSHVILIAFALDTPDSLENVSVKWNEEVRSICGSAIPVLLVGCKKDLRDAAGGQGHFVTKAEVRAFVLFASVDQLIQESRRRRSRK
jgi:GTPase SAR1 family protein